MTAPLRFSSAGNQVSDMILMFLDVSQSLLEILLILFGIETESVMVAWCLL